jgi:hypothetical protein
MRITGVMGLIISPATTRKRSVRTKTLLVMETTTETNDKAKVITYRIGRMRAVL